MKYARDRPMKIQQKKESFPGQEKKRKRKNLISIHELYYLLNSLVIHMFLSSVLLQNEYDAFPVELGQSITVL